MKLANKVSIITGARRGLGLATAKLFFEEGATVIGIDLMEPDKEILHTIFNRAGKVSFKKVDITNSGEVRRFASEILENYGTVDILVNNAAIHTVGNIEEMTEEIFRATMEVNVFGAFYVTKYVIPMMKNNKSGGAIVNVSSNLGLMGAEGRVAYPTSKAAIINFTRCLALDYAKYNIRVNAVAPGTIGTEMTMDFFKKKHSEEFIRENRALHPLNRFAEPEEVAKGILYLAADDSSFVTGSVLSIDGGYTSGK